ncbi:carbohydrate ABC transporter permease [Bailinhaonella thermotolerans]|uniref:Sugar ABC transporter permease n=1 Tax=Bailinhaonella thermotolerans TaxID=1070861 RepID=A0A3A4AL82_9ACTN|nr:sugar ABC transporter permease [Bailinhaonella thermotolerans]RJL26543.1 sugar ABC transporter permease [Bailinhaonella thermotolerans]
MTTTSQANPVRGGGHRAPAPPRAHRPSRRSRRVGRLTPYVLLLPGLLIIAGLLLYPMYQLLVMSTQKVGLRQIRGAEADSVGAENYERILTSEVFWSSLRNTIVFAAVAVTLTLLVGTLVGILLNKLGKRMSTAVVVSAMLAWATPQAAVAVLWRWLFDEQSGVANRAFDLLPDWLSELLFGRADWTGYTWFLESFPTYVVLTLCVVWASFPFIAVSVLAGLRSIPGELHEAARMDGAGAWRAFWRVTFPMLRPVFSVLVVLSIIWDFKVFTQLYILANGMGNKEVFNLSLYAYAEAFSSPPAMGMGSAIAVVLTVILLIITGVYVRQIVRQEEV